eukprot:21013-Heterococcus_DN1.PRE.2
MRCARARSARMSCCSASAATIGSYVRGVSLPLLPSPTSAICTISRHIGSVGVASVAARLVRIARAAS